MWSGYALQISYLLGEPLVTTWALGKHLVFRSAWTTWNTFVRKKNLNFLIHPRTPLMKYCCKEDDVFYHTVMMNTKTNTETSKELRNWWVFSRMYADMRINSHRQNMAHGYNCEVFTLRKYIYCSPKIYDVTLRTPFDTFKTTTMICCSVKDLLWSPSSSLTSDLVHLLQNSWGTR